MAEARRKRKARPKPKAKPRPSTKGKKKPRKREKATGTTLPSGKGGRTLWTAPRRKKILEAVRKGHYRKVAALTVRVDERTIKQWVANGRDNLEKVTLGQARVNTYGQWVLDLDAAEAEAEIEALDVIIDVARDKKADPRIRVQSAQWYLERKHPARYGIQRVELTGAGGGPIQVDARSALLERLAAMAKRSASAPTPE